MITTNRLIWFKQKAISEWKTDPMFVLGTSIIYQIEATDEWGIDEYKLIRMYISGFIGTSYKIVDHGSDISELTAKAESDFFDFIELITFDAPTRKTTKRIIENIKLTDVNISTLEQSDTVHNTKLFQYLSLREHLCGFLRFYLWMDLRETGFIDQLIKFVVKRRYNEKVRRLYDDILDSVSLIVEEELSNPSVVEGNSILSNSSKIERNMLHDL